MSLPVKKLPAKKFDSQMSAKFEMDAAGNFRIGVGNQFSDWVPYRSIAMVNTGTNTYIGVTEYHANNGIPIEQVCAVIPVVTERTFDVVRKEL